MIFVLIRTTFFFLVTVVSLRLMGKRQIGELEPTELVVTILISDIATLCLQDIDLPILYALVPIVALVSYEILSSALSLKWMGFRECMAGSYSVIINDGVIDQKEMRKAQLTIDEVMEEVRGKGALSLDEVRFCILETSGKMSVLLKKEVEQHALPIPIVVDGKPVKKNLKKLKINREHLNGILSAHGIASVKDVFWMAIENGTISFVRKKI